MSEVIKGWSHQLPTVDGFYWFRDVEREEQGIGLVSAINRYAEILIWSDKSDEDSYISSAYWAEGETENTNWEWIAIELPDGFYGG